MMSTALLRPSVTRTSPGGKSQPRRRRFGDETLPITDDMRARRAAISPANESSSPGTKTAWYNISGGRKVSALPSDSWSLTYRGAPYQSGAVNPKQFFPFVLGAVLYTFPVQADWPEFRGPHGDGHVPGKSVGLPLHWSETNNVKWKAEIPQQGISAPIVLNGQVWLTSATADGHDFFVICVDADTGKVRFNEKIFHSDNPESLGNGKGMNTYATPTAVVEPGRVYVHFGS